MNQTEIIRLLHATHDHNEWTGSVMGWNVASDFIDNIPDDLDEITQDALFDAIANRIAWTLDSESGDTNEIWESWCNGDIEANFGDIQDIIDNL